MTYARGLMKHAMQTPSATTSPLTPETVFEVERLLNELASSSRARRETAERALQKIGPDAALALQILIEPEVRKKRALRRPLRWLPSLAFITLIALAASCLVHLHAAALLSVPAVLTAVGTGLLISRDRLPRKDRIQIQTLLKFEDKRLLPLLLDLRLMAAGHSEDRKIAALIARLFASLEPGDRALISHEQRCQLNDSLQLAAGTDSRYFVAILKGLQHIGDHTSIPVVSRLAEADPRSTVTQAARECLSYLNARAAKQGHILLRPAAASECAAEVLVRAVAQAPAEQSALLRAVDLPAEGRP